MVAINRQILTGAAKVAPAATRSLSSSASRLSPAPLDFSKLKITKTTTPKTLPPNDQLVFGKTFTGMLSFLFIYLYIQLFFFWSNISLILNRFKYP